MRKYLLTAFLAIFHALAWAQFSISGKISAADDAAALAGASVVLKETGKGIAADEQGKFSFSALPAGAYTLQVSFVGYRSYEQRIDLQQDVTLDIRLVATALWSKEVDVFGTRLYPITKTIVDKKDLAPQNLGQDLPILLNFTPSMVTTSDAGAGIGYTGMRIRGSDPTRINVTINDVPLNDAESQGVFWVNMPDFATSVAQIQVQRGVGTSVNGAGAFGASVNITTLAPEDKASAEITNGYGSFNTWRHNVVFHSGVINNRFKMMGRLSKITSDGFIDRAFSDLKSFYLSGVYLTEKGSITANVWSGKEQTYQAWYGVPEEELRKGNRRFNSQTYDNETDNYQQDHYQLIWQTAVGSGWNWKSTLHYTRGRGYFEQYRDNDRLSRYQIAPVQIGNQTITRSDLIRRRWLDNHFYGLTWQLSYQSPQLRADAPVLDFQFGGAANRYLGKHFGEVIWARFAGNSNIRHRYYDNDAVKDDINAYARANYQLADGLFVFGDLQLRRINYDFLGYDNRLENVTQNANLLFFNPKAGVRYLIGSSEWYASYAVGHREPNRRDYTESSPASRPRPEQLHNIEAGYSGSVGNWAFNANLFYMYYKDQLVLTGSVNDVGGYIRQNIPDSYRAGIELVAAWQINKKLKWEGNAAFSRNKIRAFTEFLDDYDNGGQVSIEHKNTDIAFSPAVVAASQLHFAPAKYLQISLLTKYVSRQYLDNTQQLSRSLDAFFTNDLRMSYAIRPKFCSEIGLGLLVNNVFNHLYENNGYTFGYVSGGQPTYENFYFPQAGTNFLAQVSVKF